MWIFNLNFSGLLETSTAVENNISSENAPPLPNEPAPSQPPPPQFDSDDLDKLPPLPPGSPPPVTGICDVPLRKYILTLKKYLNNYICL